MTATFKGSDPTGLTPFAGLIAGICLLGVVAGCGGGAATGDVAPPSARASFTPAIHLFAEPVVANLDVIADPNSFDPSRIRVRPDFRPYDIVGDVARRVQSFGGVTRVSYRFTLRCLRIECIPNILQSAAGEDEPGRGDRVTFRFKPAEVLYPKAGQKPEVIRRVLWPTLESVSRINASLVPRTGFVFKATLTPLPEPTYRAAPAVLGVGLLAAAVALLALPAWLVARSARRRRPPPPEPEPEVPRLERALRLVEWARAREDGADRRKALESLAVELEIAQKAQLAEGARALAWAPASPSPSAADELVATVRGSDAEAS